MEERKFVSQPLYVQLREALVQRISSGVWKPGAAIPNEIELAREFGLSAGTVRKALDWMEQAQLVVRQQGRGTFVRDPSGGELAQRYDNIRAPNGGPLATQTRTLAVVEGEATAYECARLQLEPGRIVRRVRQLRSLDTAPFMLEDFAIPVDMFPVSNPGPYNLVETAKANGVLLGRSDEKLFLERVSEGAAADLGVSAETPILKLDRIIWSIDRKPTEWRIGSCLLGRNYYAAHVGAG